MTEQRSVDIGGDKQLPMIGLGTWNVTGENVGRSVRAALAGNCAVRSGVLVKRMLTTSSCVSSLRAKSSLTRRAVLASISAFESSVHVIAPRRAWSLIG